MKYTDILSPLFNQNVKNEANVRSKAEGRSNKLRKTPPTHNSCGQGPFHKDRSRRPRIRPEGPVNAKGIEGGSDVYFAMNLYF